MTVTVATLMLEESDMVYSNESVPQKSSTGVYRTSNSRVVHVPGVDWVIDTKASWYLCDIAEREKSVISVCHHVSDSSKTCKTLSFVKLLNKSSSGYSAYLREHSRHYQAAK